MQDKNYYTHGQISCRLTRHEMEKLKAGFQSSGCKTLGAYCRKILTGKPIAYYYRNRSIDDHVERTIEINKTLCVLCEINSLTEQERSWIMQQVETLKSINLQILEHARKNQIP